VIDLSAISAALETQLAANLPSTDAGFSYTVSRGEPVNPYPERAPWVGIYIVRAESDPARLGVGTGNSLWSSLVTIRLVIQATSYANGGVCEDLLGEYTKDVWEAIEADRTLGGTLDLLLAYELERQFVDTADNALFFQQALLTLSGRKNT